MNSSIRRRASGFARQRSNWFDSSASPASHSGSPAMTAAFARAIASAGKDAICRAFETPGPVDMEKVDAQQARRFLDRLVGYQLSPLLW